MLRRTWNDLQTITNLGFSTRTVRLACFWCGISTSGPPWENIVVKECGGLATQSFTKEEQFGDISKGARVHIRTKIGPFWQNMLAEHVEHQEPDFLWIDEKGPFAVGVTRIDLYRMVKIRFWKMKSTINFRLPSLVAGAFARKSCAYICFAMPEPKEIWSKREKYHLEPQKIAGRIKDWLAQSCVLSQTMGHHVFRVSRRKQVSGKIGLRLIPQDGRDRCGCSSCGEPIAIDGERNAD